jgi:DNA-directed RNA polymerase subunit beta
MYRMERVVRERMTTQDTDTITPQSVVNTKPVASAIKEFFGSRSSRSSWTRRTP